MNINIKAAIYFGIALTVGYASAALFGFPGWTGSLYVGVLLVIVLFTIYFMAESDKQASTIETGEIKFVVTGEGVKRVLENIEGWHYNESTGEIVEDSRTYHRPETFLQEWLGIYWVSILYPKTEIHRYDFEWPKLLMGGHPREKIIGTLVKVGGEGDYAIEHRDENIDSLYFRYPYPVFAEEVELKGNVKIDILINVTFQVVFPKIPIFILKGKWLASATAAVNGALADLVRTYDLDGFRNLEKQAAGNQLSQTIMEVNGDRIGDGKYSPGIIQSFGVKVYKVDFIKYDLNEKYRDVIDAATAAQVAEGHANARRNEAKGEADAIASIQGAEADALQKLLAAASTHPLGGQVLIEQVRTKGLGDFKGSVLSLGGDRTGVMVNVPEKKQETPVAEPTPPTAAAT